MFRTAATATTSNQYYFGSYDDSTGSPLTDGSNVPWTKSALKKLRKRQETHQIQHDKYLSTAVSATPRRQNEPSPPAEIVNNNHNNTDPVTAAATNNTTNDNHITTATTTAAAATTTAMPLPSSHRDELPRCVDSDLVLPPPPPPIDISSTDCPIVAGTFGKRQGIQMSSDMGPFCHVVQV